MRLHSYMLFLVGLRDFATVLHLIYIMERCLEAVVSSEQGVFLAI